MNYEQGFIRINVEEDNSKDRKRDVQKQKGKKQGAIYDLENTGE